MSAILVDTLGIEIQTQDACEAMDARGFVWTSPTNEKQVKNCSEIDSLLTGEAEWFCVSSESMAYFNSTEPDRSKCRSDLLSSEISLEAVLNYTSDLSRALTGGEVVQIVTIVEETETEDKLEDLFNITNNLLESKISWSEIVTVEVVGALKYNLNSNTRMFEKLVAKMKDFMSNSPSELNISHPNIVLVKKSMGESGDITFPESDSDSQIVVSPEDSFQGLSYQGLLIRGETLKIFYKSNHELDETKLATELLFFKFEEDSTIIKSVDLNLNYLDEDFPASCPNCSVCALLNKVGSDENIWETDAKDGTCTADTDSQEVLACHCDITRLKYTLLFGGFQSVDIILPMFNTTTTSTTSTTTTSTTTTNINTTPVTSSNTSTGTETVSTDNTLSSSTAAATTSSPETTTTSMLNNNSCTSPWNEDSSVSVFTFTFIGFSQFLVLIVFLIQWFYNYHRYIS